MMSQTWITRYCMKWARPNDSGAASFSWNTRIFSTTHKMSYVLIVNHRTEVYDEKSVLIEDQYRYTLLFNANRYFQCVIRMYSILVRPRMFVHDDFSQLRGELITTIQSAARYATDWVHTTLDLLIRRLIEYCVSRMLQLTSKGHLCACSPLHVILFRRFSVGHRIFFHVSSDIMSLMTIWNCDTMLSVFCQSSTLRDRYTLDYGSRRGFDMCHRTFVVCLIQYRQMMCKLSR